MKALVCGRCADIRALQEDWVTCECGNLSGRWTNSFTGTAEFKARDKSYGYILGLNNRVLGPAIQGHLGMYQDFRLAHDEATKAPNHVFDQSRANCWAVVFKIGTTNDTKWVQDGV